MAADTDDILRQPVCRLISQQLEFHRDQRRVLPGQGDEGVDAVRVALGDLLGVAAIGQPFAVHAAAIQELTRHPVLFQKGRSEVLRQFAQPALPPQVDLPQPVTRGIEALHEESIVSL